MKRICLALTAAIGLSSCTTTQRVIGGVVVAASAFAIYASGDKSKARVIQPDPVAISDADTSGVMLSRGGMLIDARHVLHVTHWPDLTGQQVDFRDRYGNPVRRTVVKKTIISPFPPGGDLCILTLDEPLDMSRHTAVPIAAATPGMDVTILRLDRPPLASRISAVGKLRVSASADYEATATAHEYATGSNDIRSGDSGQPWLAKVAGRRCLVGFTSSGWMGQSPNLSAFHPAIDLFTATK